MAIYKQNKEVQNLYYKNSTGLKTISSVYYCTEDGLKLIWEDGNFRTADDCSFITSDGSTFNVFIK